MLKLQVGQVFELWCGWCSEPKWKWYVLAIIEPVPRYFMINSKPAAFQLKNALLMAQLVPLLQAEHSEFMHHDSVLDCSDMYGGYTVSDLEDLYNKDQRVLLGRLSTNARRATRHVIEHSPMLTENEKAALLSHW